MIFFKAHFCFKLVLIMLSYIVIESNSMGLLYNVFHLKEKAKSYDFQKSMAFKQNQTKNGRLDMTDFNVKRIVCKTFGKFRTAWCYRHFSLMESVIGGLLLGMRECQHQFTAHLWDCSGHNKTIPRNLSRYDSMRIYKTPGRRRWRRKKHFYKKTYIDRLLRRATPESAYVRAIMAAGIAHEVTKACSKGYHDQCGCDGTIFDTPNNNSFKWSGCSHNIFFGCAFTRKFLEKTKRKKTGNLNGKGLTNLHNNNVGLQAVKVHMGRKCKCHGVSGSCEMKTCYRALPAFRIVGSFLKSRFHQQLKVTYYKQQLRTVKNGVHVAVRFTNNNLIYIAPSPNFCHHDPYVGSLGTRGRKCVEAKLLKLSNLTHLPEKQRTNYVRALLPYDQKRQTAEAYNQKITQQPGLCENLCCGRGNTRKAYTIIERCLCEFKWCCDVVCKRCRRHIVESICR